MAATAHADAPASRFLQPHLKVGERLLHVFSRAISIEGSGFKEIVERVSGTDESIIDAVGRRGTMVHGDYRVDGHPPGSDRIRITADGTSICRGSHCMVDHETSGMLFNPLLWGHPPQDLNAGSTWTATIAEPWELGPPGTETVRVVRLDAVHHTIVLLRQGHGHGPSLHDQHTKSLAITTSEGDTLETALVPGETRWTGRTIVRDGIIVADTIMVERHVTLVAADGRKFGGEQRAYTLENLLGDQP